MRPKAFFLWNGQKIIALKINMSSWVKKSHLRNAFKMWIPGSYPRDMRQAPGNSHFYQAFQEILVLSTMDHTLRKSEKNGISL